MAGIKAPSVALSDAERFPLLNNLELLQQLRQDEVAPLFNFQSGDRLDAPKLEKVKQYAKQIRGRKQFWEPNAIPHWLETYWTQCHQGVPFYKNRPSAFIDQATIRRSDIGNSPWEFVSDTAILEDLLVYHTSGTTGAAMNVLFDAISQACWIPQLQSVLDTYQIHLDDDSERVAIALICSQNQTLTYASLSTYLEGAGILKINLKPEDWKAPQHRQAYLEKYNPQILTGEPFAFMDLMQLNAKIKPKALISSAMKLSEGLKTQLEQHFECPVIDIYSLTECRMISFAENGRHRAIRPELYLEVFDPEKDILLPYGAWGELVVTGGTNPFLPLVRYRTGDFCSVQIEDGVPYLYDLEARKPVAFYTKAGKLINNIEISRAMMHYPLVGFKLHQNSSHELFFTGWCQEPIQEQVNLSLQSIFGLDFGITVEILPADSHNTYKNVSYSSDLYEL